MKSVFDVNFEGKKVFLRADFNVPVKDGEVVDDYRIEKEIPTIKLILEQKPKQLIIASHLGRPKGEVNKEFSLSCVADRLSVLLGMPVEFVDDCLKEPSTDAKIVLLENTRFYKGDEDNDLEFAKKLSHNADVFVFDAFGTAHRKNASTTGVAQFCKEKCLGLLVLDELKSLNFTDEDKPLYAIIGSAKISDKIPVIESLLKKVDKILLGGGVVFTFLKAKGYEIGKSICDDSLVEECKKLLEKYPEKIVLPVDIVVSESEEEGYEIYTVGVDNIPANMKGLDIGDKTVELFVKELKNAKTIFWNGPLGVFEIEPFDTGSREIAEVLSNMKAKVVAGGGDTEDALRLFGVRHRFAHVSTGGGASINYVAGEKLPALEGYD